MSKISLYNAYDPGLFGLQHPEAIVTNLGLDLASYQAMQRTFVELCNTLGNRALAYIQEQNGHGNDVVITPLPVDPHLMDLLSKQKGVEQHPTLFSTGGLTNPQHDLGQQILDSGNLLTQLKGNLNGGHNVIHPRTSTPGSIQLAIALGINHIPRYPLSLDHERIEGVHPTFDYIETHPAEKNNSKVENFTALKEIDADLGTDLAPAGGVAYEAVSAVRHIVELARIGKKTMIKADLSVDGMGNLIIDPFTTKINGVPFLECEKSTQINYLKQQLNSKAIPIGPEAGIVVQELLEEKIADPSLEYYSMPLHMNMGPILTYSCAMLIENGGFAGSLMTQHMYGEVEGLEGVEKDEYKKVMQQAEKVAKEFSRRRQVDGYVGINDCDIAICRNHRTGELYAKILEFNFNRETGGTATEYIMRSFNAPYVLARDGIHGEAYTQPLGEIAGKLEQAGLLYTRDTHSGAIILNYAHGSLMPVIVGNSLADVLRIDRALHAEAAA